MSPAATPVARWFDRELQSQSNPPRAARERELQRDERQYGGNRKKFSFGTENSCTIPISSSI